ncbi:protein Daple isoform X3 [Narcine bancroftii]
MNLPNVLLIAKDPLSGKSMEEIRKMLLLMLGCAVQCDRKEEFIERIKQLDITTQTAIVAHIQEITHNQENVFDLQWMELAEVSAEDLETLSRSMVFHLKRLLDDRDEYSEMIVELTQDRDYLQTQQLLPSPVKSSSPECPTSPNNKLEKGEKQHLAVDLADTKAKLRRIRQELEEKAEQLLDSKHEVERLDAELLKLRQENLQLATDARSVRAYQDELDSLREKANRVDRLENELGRCRERLHDVDFYKARMEELREDNMVLIETKTILEEQLVIARARCDKLHDLEKENLQLKSKLQDLETDREADRKRIEELLEENMVLEIEKKQSMNESAHLGWELEQMTKSTDLLDAGRKSFVLEMNDCASSRILKLEKENQSLQHGVRELQQALLSAEESQSRIAELETENKLLSTKVGNLQAELEREKQSNQDLGNLSEELLQDKTTLKQSLEMLQADKERQVKALEQENEHLNQAITSLRERSEVSAEARVKDIEKENKILHETITETSGQLAKLEFANKQAQKELLQYKEKEERAESLEKDVHRLEQDNEQLQKKVASLKVTCEDVEQEVSNLEVENSKLKKSLNSLQNSLIKLESVKKDNKELEEENVELRRKVETLKVTRAKLLREEMEKQELEKEKDELRKSVELLKSLNQKSERLEVSYQSLNSENQRLQMVLDNSDTKIRQLEEELQDAERENRDLQKNLEQLRISGKRLAMLEKDSKVLEHEAAQLEKDKEALDRENQRLRQQVELKDAILDDHNQKLSSLEKEKRTLEKEVGRYKESTSKLKELEVDYKEVVKQSTINTRTLATLREELFHEKIRSQELSNELEKLNQDLEKIGLSKERLLQEEHVRDDNKYKLLETRIESTLKKTLDIKEEKVQALESRLAESSSLNQQLRIELSTVKWNLEALLQRQEEERLSPTSVGLSQPDTTEKELVKVKDMVIKVERNNAALQAEKELLQGQIKQLEAQNSAVNSHIAVLQRQAASMQEHSNALQIQNAKLQVENSTLNSQSVALMGQNAMLQNVQVGLEKEKENMARQKEELKATHDSLLQDNERLVLLSERQSAECEALIAQQASFKASYRNLEFKHKELEEKYLGLLKEQAGLEQLETELRAQQESLQREVRRNSVITEENRQLKADVTRLHSMNSVLKEEYERLQSLTKECRNSLSCTELDLERWKAQYHELKEQHQNLDISQTKMDNHCELLTQLKSNLEEENLYLLNQIQSLNQQNQNLLERSMESKELYHEEQKQYIDKLNSLRRQKEKLEEKIMDQYKFYEPTSKRKNHWVTAKALVKLMKPKKESAKERPKLAPEGQTRQTEPADPPIASPTPKVGLDNSSQGSASLEESAAGTPSKAPDEGQKLREVSRSSAPSPSSNPSPDSTLGSRHRSTELGSLALSTSAIHLTTSQSTPKFNSRHHTKVRGKESFNSDDDLQAQLLELEFTKNGNASLGAADLTDREQDGLSGEDLVPNRVLGTAPTDNALYRSRSALLPSTRLEPAMAQRVPVSYSTLQRGKEGQLGSRTGASSPGSEMVTLEEFLQESGRSAAGASSRDDLLTDYYKRKSEPANLCEHPNRKETPKMPTSPAGSDSLDGRVCRPGQFVRPCPHVSGHESSSTPSPRQMPPAQGGGPSTPKPVERAAQPQPQHMRAGSSRGSSLARAFSLASADLLRCESFRQEPQHRVPLSRDNGKGGWKSTADCRSSSLHPEPRERPQSARTPATAVDICCRALDPRRLSLAPPKDERFLSLPQHLGGLSPPPGEQQHISEDRRHLRETPPVSPMPGTPLQADEPKAWGRRARQDCNASPQCRSPGIGNTPQGAEDPGKGGTGGSKSMPASPDPTSDQQTVWYEYGCV